MNTNTSSAAPSAAAASPAATMDTIKAAAASAAKKGLLIGIGALLGFGTATYMNQRKTQVASPNQPAQ